jgi:non-ribosomal peptide synthetase component F
MSERDRPEIEPLIGFLIGTQVLRTNLSGQPDFSELLRRVQRGLAEIQTHRAAQFDQIVATLQPERNPSYTPLFQVMLIWRDYEDQPEIVGLPGLVVERLMTKTMTAKCDLTFFVIDEGDEVYFEIEYSTDLFEAARIERLSGHLLMLLGAVAEDPSQAISAVPLLTPAEQHQLLVEWNEIGADDEYT